MAEGQDARGNDLTLIASFLALSPRQRLDAWEAFTSDLLEMRQHAPTAEHLLGPGHQLLETDLGPIDSMGTVGPAGGLLDDPALRGRCVLANLGGPTARLLELEAVVELKRAAGRPKNLAALPLLEATLRERGTRPVKE